MDESKLCVAICDDDENARRIILSSIQGTFPGVAVEALAYPSADILLADLENHNFDLLLLDIDMPGMDGITLAQTLRGMGGAIDIIYISNREDKVFQSLTTEPCGFIRKSRFLEDMNEVMSRYLKRRRSRRRSEESSLVIQERGRVKKLPIHRICYVEGSGKTQMVYVEGEREGLCVHSAMQKLEEELTAYGFLRIHKGYLVNYRFVRQIEPTEVLLTTGQRIPLARRKLQEVREAYLELMAEHNSLIF